MRRTAAVAALAALAVVIPTLAWASPYDPERDPQGHVPTLMREIYRGPEGAHAAIAADRKFVADMRRHHQGAVAMAQAYLAAPQGRHPLVTRLAEAIIANQRFEIAMLDDVDRKTARPPRRLPGGLVVRQAGWDGLEHTLRFVKSPPPGFLELWLERAPTSATDVRFAKAMIVHHRAAVDMARAYNADPAADNRILKALNRDIVIDQGYEIALLERLITRYPGNPDTVALDPAMVHGMPDHGGH